MSCLLLFLAVSWAGGAGSREAPSAVQIKPAGISLKAPPEMETRRSCVLRRRGGGDMRILSVSSSDPAIGVEWRDNPAGRTHVITATLPPGYRTAAGQPVEILVQTDLATNPLIRIPVRVWPGRSLQDSGWLSRARGQIGNPMPLVVVDQFGLGEVLRFRGCRPPPWKCARFGIRQLSRETVNGDPPAIATACRWTAASYRLMWHHR